MHLNLQTMVKLRPKRLATQVQLTETVATMALADIIATRDSLTKGPPD